MTKVLNLDKIETKRDKVIILGGVEHVMKTLTVKEYIDQMKAGAEISTLNDSDDISSADRILELSINALMKAFPTITREQFEALNIDQLTAIRELVDDVADKELETEDTGEGEATGKKE